MQPAGDAISFDENEWVSSSVQIRSTLSILSITRIVKKKVSWTVLSIEFVYGTFRAVEVTRNFIAMNIEYVIVKIGAQYVMYNLC